MERAERGRDRQRGTDGGGSGTRGVACAKTSAVPTLDTTAASCALTFNFNGYLYFRSLDQAGNWSSLGQERVANLTRLPQITSLSVPPTAFGRVPLSWTTDETEGLATFRVDIQELGQSAWEPVAEGLTSLQTSFAAGRSGHTYRFRVQAVDPLGGAGEWRLSDPCTITAEGVRKYYPLGQHVVAERVGASLSYLATDQVGSISVVTDNTGNLVSQIRYDPFGQLRWQEGVSPTERSYTGQRAESFGLLDYNARYYDPYLNRFLSPDTIVPDQFNPLDWDRYSYVNNNPVSYNDPTGHRYDDGCRTEGCSAKQGEEYRDYVYDIIHSDNGREQNTQVVETTEQVIEIGASMLLEPLDWGFTLRDCFSGDCSPVMLLGLLPLIPGSKVDDITEMLADGASSQLISRNKLLGDAFRDQVADFFVDAGYGVEKEVVKHTPFGPRRIDREISSSDGLVLGGIETKWGGSRYTSSQRAKDAWLQIAGYIVNVVRSK